jgi:regulator of nucleoside diphosphate kinase
MTELRCHPSIFVPALDYDRLFALAESHARREPDVADFLMRELERASTKAPYGPERIVRMQSHVRFRDDSTGRVRNVQLVYPGEADPAKGRISILTPVGTALIGLTEGQSFQWKDRGGKSKSLTVLNVRDLLENGD